jgi:hypothetical protein
VLDVFDELAQQRPVLTVEVVAQLEELTPLV